MTALLLFHLFHLLDFVLLFGLLAELLDDALRNGDFALLTIVEFRRVSLVLDKLAFQIVRLVVGNAIPVSGFNHFSLVGQDDRVLSLAFWGFQLC